MGKGNKEVDDMQWWHEKEEEILFKQQCLMLRDGSKTFILDLYELKQKSQIWQLIKKLQ